MTDLTNPPKPHIDNMAVIADFAELECLRRDDANVSITDIVRIIQREHDGLSDDAVFERVSEAFADLEDRGRHCGEVDGRYPFRVLDRGTMLQFERTSDATTAEPTTYLYLLLATRMNMARERMQGHEDATALFEEVCREVAIRFFGGPRPEVEAIVFGTSRATNQDDLDADDEIDRTSFVDAVNHLCGELGEGLRFQAASASPRVTAKDGRLDVVVWRRFADRRPGQLIAFGQCKTGTNWDRDVYQLQPEAFCSKWMLKRPAAIPTRMFFIAERVCGDASDVAHGTWYELCCDSGILFDRCRIMEFASGLPDPLTRRIRKWVRAAAKVKGLRVA